MTAARHHAGWPPSRRWPTNPRGTRLIAARTPFALSSERLARLLRLLSGTDSVDFRLGLPDTGSLSALTALGIDPLDAQLQQVTYFDTQDLALHRRGVVVRARRNRRRSDSLVGLCPLVAERIPTQVPGHLRKVRGFGVQIDAVPGGYFCTGSLTADLDDVEVKDVLAGRRPVRKLLTEEQRALFATCTGGEISPDDLRILGPINVFRAKITKLHGRRLTAEVWNYPDGYRILELATTCAPADVFDVATATRSFLDARGMDRLAEHRSETAAVLAFFARELTNDLTADHRGADQTSPEV